MRSDNISAPNASPQQAHSDIANRDIKIACVHIFCWLAFLALPALFNNRLNNPGLKDILLDIFAVPPRMVNSVYYVGLFYFSYYVAIPAFYFTNRYVLLVLYFTASFALFVLINYLMMPPAFLIDHHREMHLLGPSYNLFMYIITCVVSFALCLYAKWRKVHDEKLVAEIAFLRAQINPHFLFNTLNSIYSLSLLKSDAAPEAVLKLSGIMRYAVSDASRETVLLEKELNYITDYIALQKLRIPENVQLDYALNGSTAGIKIAPFIIIPFIENAFKYGVNAEEESSITINITLKANLLYVEVHNLKVTISGGSENSTGLGIDTTRQRLALIYPGKHTISIADTAKDFKILLNLELT